MKFSPGVDWAARSSHIEYLPRRARDFALLVGPHHATTDTAVVPRDHPGVGGVPHGVEHDAQELQPVHDAGPDLRRVLADPAREDHAIESAEGSRERADSLLHAIAENRQGLRGPHVVLLPLKKVAHIGARLRD